MSSTTRMLDLPYSAEAWNPETWVPMVPGCDCRQNPWASHERDILGRDCFKCKGEIRLIPDEETA